MALGAEGGTYWSETITASCTASAGRSPARRCFDKCPSAVSEIELVGDVGQGASLVPLSSPSPSVCVSVSASAAVMDTITSRDATKALFL